MTSSKIFEKISNLKYDSCFSSEVSKLISARSKPNLWAYKTSIHESKYCLLIGIQKKNSWDFYKMVIFSKIFDEVISYIIRWNAGKQINPISEHFIKQKFEFKSGCIVFDLSDVMCYYFLEYFFFQKKTSFFQWVCILRLYLGP